MSIENLVTSLELSKKLKEAGVPQRSVFYWECEYKNSKLIAKKIVYKYEIVPDIVPTEMKIRYGNEVFYYSAYLAGELGELLPSGTKLWRRNFWFCETFGGSKLIFTDLEAEARGRMLLWLIKNKYVRVEELK